MPADAPTWHRARSGGFLRKFHLPAEYGNSATTIVPLCSCRCAFEPGETTTAPREHQRCKNCAALNAAASAAAVPEVPPCVSG
jgi:hypothetical protein